MKLWITGADGLLGAALRPRAALATNRAQADISNLDSLRTFAKQNPGITHIVNCAAFSLVDLAETRQDDAFSANAVGPENLGRLSQEINARLIHISTDYVFPGNLRRPLNETDPVQPLSYYGFTKLEGERRLLQVNPQACIIRTSWIFGHGGKNFVSKLLQMLHQTNPIRLTSDHWNCPTYAPDLANAILQMLDQSGIYHYSNTGPATKYEFGLAMRDLARSAGFNPLAPEILAVPGSTFPSPAVRPVYSAFDTTKIEQHLAIRSWPNALNSYLLEAYAATR